MSEQQIQSLNDFAPGDLVCLKSGGPVMTVEKTGQTAMLNEDAVWVVWFDKVGNKQVVQRDTFAPVLLKKHVPTASMVVTRG